uniref:Uncharacterized protein n=1 Tax=Nelumbo nucifera TaxID=4432 RepID=A0A822YFX9_NELNU|nr:TPA_asm: hypothetical protein HUJ06_031607 [Nelumbo nucifera]
MEKRGGCTVVSVFPNTKRKLQSTRSRSWDFLGMLQTVKRNNEIESRCKVLPYWSQNSQPISSRYRWAWNTSTVAGSPANPAGLCRWARSIHKLNLV